MGKRIKGQCVGVSRFKNKKFAFSRADGESDDVFVHENYLMDNQQGLQPGDRVEFTINIEPGTGEKRAVRVCKLDGFESKENKKRTLEVLKDNPFLGKDESMEPMTKKQRTDDMMRVNCKTDTDSVRMNVNLMKIKLAD